ncbi:MAG: hypothetical protein ACTSUO_06030 [Candidatus Thorarchaeota archaeon]
MNQEKTMMAVFKNDFKTVFRMIRDILGIEHEMTKSEVKIRQIEEKKVRTAVDIVLLTEALRVLTSAEVETVIVDVFDSNEYEALVLTGIDNEYTKRIEIWIAPRFIPEEYVKKK